MKLLVLLAFVATATAVDTEKSNAITLIDYYKTMSGNRIIDGKEAAYFQFPWQVEIRSVLANGTEQLCGGALISKRWVLTAAHCFEGASIKRLVLGSINLSGSRNQLDVVRTARYEPILHDIEDVALVEMVTPVNITENVRTIQLPSKIDYVPAGKEVIISGWGRTSDNGPVSTKLRYVYLETISNSECTEYYDAATITPSILCCRGNPHHSSCNGDSGGPLIMYSDNGVPVLQGIISFVHRAKGCAGGAPSGYVRTSSILDWISQTTGLKI